MSINLYLGKNIYIIQLKNSNYKPTPSIFRCCLFYSKFILEICNLNKNVIKKIYKENFFKHCRNKTKIVYFKDCKNKKVFLNSNIIKFANILDETQPGKEFNYQQLMTCLDDIAQKYK